MTGIEESFQNSSASLSRDQMLFERLSRFCEEATKILSKHHQCEMAIPEGKSVDLNKNEPEEQQRMVFKNWLPLSPQDGESIMFLTVDGKTKATVDLYANHDTGEITLFTPSDASSTRSTVEKDCLNSAMIFRAVKDYLNLAGVRDSRTLRSIEQALDECFKDNLDPNVVSHEAAPAQRSKDLG